MLNCLQKIFSVLHVLTYVRPQFHESLARITFLGSLFYSSFVAL